MWQKLKTFLASLTLQQVKDFFSGLSGHRTVISAGISFILKGLVGLNIMTSNSLSEVDSLTNLILSGGSLVGDACAVWFRLVADKPGYLSTTAKDARLAASQQNPAAPSK